MIFILESPHSLTMNITEPHNITKEYGESLHVKCRVYGAPVPTVTWINKTNNREVIIGSNSAVLSLNFITEQQAGTYVCKGKNSDGEVESSISINVNCKYKHQICILYMSIIISTGL